MYNIFKKCIIYNNFLINIHLKLIDNNIFLDCFLYYLYLFYILFYNYFLYYFIFILYITLY